MRDLTMIVMMKMKTMKGDDGSDDGKKEVEVEDVGYSCQTRNTRERWVKKTTLWVWVWCLRWRTRSTKQVNQSVAVMMTPYKVVEHQKRHCEEHLYGMADLWWVSSKANGLDVESCKVMMKSKGCCCCCCGIILPFVRV